MKKRILIVAASLILIAGIASSVSALAPSSVDPGGNTPMSGLSINGINVTSADQIVSVCNPINFKGYTTVNSTLTLKILSDPITGNTTSNQDGYFEWSVGTVPAGRHNVYATVVDAYGHQSAETHIATIDVCSTTTGSTASSLAIVGIQIAKMGLIAGLLAFLIYGGYFLLKKKTVKS